MKNILLLIVLVSIELTVNSQTILTHNVCGDLTQNNVSACSNAGECFARAFDLIDFGIDTNEEFIVEKGEVAFWGAGTWQVQIQFNIYEIDDNFPNSFNESNLIGTSQTVPVGYISTPNFNDPTVIEVIFDNPITIPSNVEKILVEVKNVGSTYVFAAGSSQSNDVSYFRTVNAGCFSSDYVTPQEYGFDDPHYFVQVHGQPYNPSLPFNMFYDGDCTMSEKSFGLSNNSSISNVVWNFGDPASGISNISNVISPTHDFSGSGSYYVSSTITDVNGNIFTLNETVNVLEPPIAFQIQDVYACEDDYASGISSAFDTSTIQNQVIGGQSNVILSYIDGSGNEFDGPLPNIMANTIANEETVTLRLAYENQLCCYVDTTFKLITNPLPNTQSITNQYSCDDNSNGIAGFDFNSIANAILQDNPNHEISFFYENNTEILDYSSALVYNAVAYEETISYIINDPQTNCSSEGVFNLVVNSNPTASQLSIIYGCDDNNDGISEYFDISGVIEQVIGNQTNVTVSFFDENYNELPNPLPNPYTNSVAFSENITVRVTNEETLCFDETVLALQTSTQPEIDTPNNIYACDEGNGFASFNTENIEAMIIGNQTNLILTFSDTDGNVIGNMLPSSFQNTIPYMQTIYVTVQDASNINCFSETSFSLITNNLPQIDLETNYNLCDLEDFLNLSVEDIYSTYEWIYETGEVISNTNSVEISLQGSYSLFLSQLENGIMCSNSFSFNLVRSNLPTIESIDFEDFGNNFIEIFATGDGDFEYSIDGVNYQDSNIFENISGGIYNAYVRDKNGCGEDSSEVTILDYPKFFTPNNDGVNDFWKIKGIENYPNAIIKIFDRYGKILYLSTSNTTGWNGIYNSQLLETNDYWFLLELNDNNSRNIAGHFTLKR